MKDRKRNFIITLLFLFSMVFTGCGNVENTAVDYGNIQNWAYAETDITGKNADVFFIAPTVYGGTEDAQNMSMNDVETKAAFLGATNMEKGIYDDDSRFFVPYYQQVGLTVYEMPEEEREEYLETAYNDVKNAFEYYMENYNEGRPIILAGFSQGAQLSIRLLEDCFADENINDLLVACYAIGWSVTDEDLNAYPHLKMAENAEDTGVIVSFNSEAEHISDSLTIPEGTKTYAINPLNWETDSTKADKSLNKGACFTDYEGNILNEIPELTGAYIDDVRGALKVTDINEEEYPPVLAIFESGVYHLYDYQFFYRNLEENVQLRIDNYIENN